MKADVKMGTVLPFRSRRAGTAEPEPQLSDEALTAPCAVGHAGALGALFDRHHEALCRFLSRLSRERTETEDLVQSPFVEVW